VHVRVFLARHAESVLNALGRVQGWADSPLTERGRAEAQVLGRALRTAEANLVAARCADMMRHRQTVEGALAAAGSEVVPEPDPRLRELAFGRFEGAANAKLRRALAAYHGHSDATGPSAGADLDVLGALVAVPALSAGSGLPAEHPDAARSRILGALESAREAGRRGGGDAFVVSSGVTIMLALAAMGVPRRAMAGGIGNAALAVLTREHGAWTAAIPGRPSGAA
jgi:probable phosphoglycerate mutase